MFQYFAEVVKEQQSLEMHGPGAQVRSSFLTSSSSSSFLAFVPHDPNRSFPSLASVIKVAPVIHLDYTPCALFKHTKEKGKGGK